ncbi:hypothetical protein BDP27DRAFT_1434120 [Rhodocollybia butyracea]|uniref:Uncharacterized protein n=1 Tax=Rhodocollybia butyracea TaxID=206335 RepID=A0A9P5P739_9AGAR|nr:hypothetical protein BDP27DRAFT_1434120 [Rhodocollybia butyracea]
MSMAFCKSEKRFITGHTGCIYVWNIQSGQIVHYFDAAQFEPFHRLNYLTISPNGKYLAWGTYITSTQKAAVYFVDLELGATDTLPPLQTDSNVNCLVFSNDGLMLAAGCHRGEAYTWPFAGGEQVRSVESVLDQDGWVLGPNNELLFWLSPSRLELMKDTGEIVLPESHLGGLWAKFLLATSAKPGF